MALTADSSHTFWWRVFIKDTMIVFGVQIERHVSDHQYGLGGFRSPLWYWSQR